MTRESARPGSATGSRATDPEAASRLRLVIGRLGRQLRHSQAGGLTPSQMSALASIDRHGPIRLSDPATRERVSATTLTRCVASLGELGLVLRVSDPEPDR